MNDLLPAACISIRIYHHITLVLYSFDNIKTNSTAFVLLVAIWRLILRGIL